MKDTVEVTAARLGDDGRGLGRDGDLEIAAADLLPGERARVAIEHHSPHRERAWGRVIERIGPASTKRVTPRCPAFGDCGGCVWQHLSYPGQLEAKRQRVLRALRGALGDTSPAVPAARPSPARWHYRNKGKYVIAAAGDALVLGAYAPRSHRVVSTLGCALVEERIDAAARALQRHLSGSALAAFDERTRTGVLRYAVIRSGGDGRVLVAIVTPSGEYQRALRDVAEGLVAGGSASGVVWCRNDSTGGALFGREIERLAGDAHVGENLSGAAVELDATAFSQVNRAQAAAMYAACATAAAGSTRAVDLYCGVGGIAFALAAAGIPTVGVERHAAAVSAAERAARALPDRDLSFARADAAHARVDGADFIAVNPPRRGLDERTLRLLVDAAPPRIAYLSCGPDTLASDLRALVGAGYDISDLQLFDLMPSTPQIETLAVLHRRS